MKNRNIIIIIVILLGITIFISFKTFFSPVHLFKNVVLDPIPESVKEIKYCRDRSAMHGALIISFKANAKDIDKIIKDKGFIKYDVVPDNVAYVIKILQSKCDNLNFGGKNIYGKEEKNEFDWKADFLFTGDSENIQYYLSI